MRNGTLERSLLENEFETLVSKSKNYINTRDKEELNSLRSDIGQLRIKLNNALRDSSNRHNANYRTALKLMLSIMNKFTDSVELMDNLKSERPIFQEFDTHKMLDIILPNIMYLVNYESWCSKLDTKKLEADYQYIESLEDQHKRVLLIYLLQDFHNMDEVINLLKIGEIYKSIAEKLVSLSQLQSYMEEQ